MYQELIDEVVRFARKYNLQLEHGYNKEEKSLYFVFTDQSKTWKHSRTIAEEDVVLCKVPSIFFAHDIISNVKKVLSHTNRNHNTCSYCFEPTYFTDKDGRKKIFEVSIVRK